MYLTATNGRLRKTGQNTPGPYFRRMRLSFITLVLNHRFGYSHQQGATAGARASTRLMYNLLRDQKIINYLFL
jgi:hypothetical protein